MDSGLMWYDPDPRKPASEKIEEASRRYREKFGVEPNACHVAPEAVASHERLRVVGNRWIRPHYYWLGVDEELPAGRRPERPGRPEAHAGAPELASASEAPRGRRRRASAAAGRSLAKSA